MEYGIEKCLLCKRHLNEDETEEGVCSKCNIGNAHTRSRPRERDDR